MNTPGADEIFMIPWNILQWVLGVIGAVFMAVSGWSVYVGRKIGGYENQFIVLRADLDQHRNDMKTRGEHYDAAIEQLARSDRDLEKLIAALPDAIMLRLEPRFAEFTRRVDEAFHRRRPSD